MWQSVISSCHWRLRILTALVMIIFSAWKVCGKTDFCKKELGMQNGVISNSQIQASSSIGSHPPSNARLNHKSGWCAAADANVGSTYLVIDVGQTVGITKIATQGDGSSKMNFVKKYKLEYSTDGIRYERVTTSSDNKYRSFTGNTNAIDVVDNDFRTILFTGRFIKIIPEEKGSGSICQRVELYGCPYVCSSGLGFENGEVTPTFIVPSSSSNKLGFTASMGRLNGNSAWCSSSFRVGEYLQFDFGKVMTITGLATQGDAKTSAVVSSYKIEYGTSTSKLAKFMLSGTERIFKGNTNHNEIVVNWFLPSLEIRYLRILPNGWETGICMRVEILGCPYDCLQPLGMEQRTIPDSSLIGSVKYDSREKDKARLNGEFCWCSKESPGIFTVDFRSIVLIRSILTQGDGYWGENYWKEFTLSYSYDGKNYFEVKENTANNDKTYETGNQNNLGVLFKHFYTNGISAKHLQIRLVPVSKDSCGRLEFYGCPQYATESLGLRLGSDVPGYNLTSNLSQDIPIPTASLGSAMPWCVDGTGTSWLQVNLGRVFIIRGIALQGNPEKDEWIKKFQVQYKKQDQLVTVKNGDANNYFETVGSRDVITNFWFPHEIKSNAVRILPKDFKTKICLRIDLYGCTRECGEKLGLESGIVKDEDIEASSSLNTDRLPKFSRLNCPQKSWTSCRSTDKCEEGQKQDATKEWIEICLSQVNTISGIIIQGAGGYPSAVKSFSLYYRYTKKGKLYEYRKHKQSKKIFAADIGRYSTEVIWLPQPLYTKCLRLQVESFIGNDAGLRWELLGCHLAGRPSVKVPQNIVVKRNTTKSISCHVSGQPGVIIKWFRGSTKIENNSIFAKKELSSNGSLTCITTSILTITGDPQKLNIEKENCNKSDHQSSGLFNCQVTFCCTSYYPGRNETGKASWSLILTDIKGKASPPQSFHTTERKAKEAVVNWTGPQEKSDFAFQHYKVTLKDRKEKDTYTPPKPGYKFIDLDPFTNYTVMIWYVNTRSVSSEPLKGHFQTDEGVATEPREIELFSTSPHTITVKWREPFKANGIISKYLIKYTLDKQSFKTESIGGNIFVSNLTKLVPFSNYSITVQGFTKKGTIDGKVSEEKFQMTKEGKPTAPTGLHTPDGVMANSFEFQWEAPKLLNGLLRYYKVHLSGSKTYNDTFRHDTDLKTINNSVRFTVYGGTSYSVRVSAVTGGGDGKANSTVVNTPVGEPGTPSMDLYSTAAGQRISLYPTSNINGPISHYVLYLAVHGASCERKSNTPASITANAVPYHVDMVLGEEVLRGANISVPLFGNSTFCYQAASGSKNHMLYGKAESLTIERRSLPKPKTIDTNSVSQSSIRIELTKAAVSSVRFYQICVVQAIGNVAQFQNPNKYPPSALKPYNKTKQEIGAPYITAEFSASNFDALKNFVIGDGAIFKRRHRSRRQRSLSDGNDIVNAPLEPGSHYFIFQRALVTENVYFTGPWIEAMTKSKPNKQKDEDDDYTPIAVGIVVPLLVIGILVAAFFLVKKRKTPIAKKSRTNKSDQLPMPEFPPEPNIGKTNPECVTADEINDSSFETDNGNVHPKPPSSVVKDPRYPQVEVDAFVRYCDQAKRDSYCLLSEQYSNLNNGQQYPWQCSLLPENKAKNRFGNIAAYDHNRVKLSSSDDNDSDYINANFVESYEGQTTYIASQGPLPSTVNDIWRLIWDYQVPVVVMLTNLVERGKKKCEQYWPSSGSETYGKIKVHLASKECYANYVIRKFTIVKGEVKNKRHLFHYHFVSWPDHGVPEHPTDLLSFRGRFRNVFPFETVSDPVLVHCSAGVGRTGTFIAIDAMLQLSKSKRFTDIFNYVNFIRSRRIHMVQTEEQYVFVFDAVLEGLTCGVTEISATNLNIETRKLKEVQSDGRTGYDAVFERLSLLSSKIYEIESEAGRKACNRSKNRNASVVPKDIYRVVLLPLTYDANESNYINATYVNGYKSKDAFIATEYPLPNTVNDFWAMVFQSNVGTIVDLSEHGEGDEKFGTILPEDYEMEERGVFVINIVHVEEDGLIIKKNISLHHKKNPQDKKECTVIQYTGWSCDVPDEANSILKLLKNVEKSQQRVENNHPAVVMCRDGCGRTGTFIAIMILLDRFKVEGIVDVFQTVKRIRFFRPEFVENVEQYKFCHDVLLSYVDSFSDYGNFF